MRSLFTLIFTVFGTAILFSQSDYFVRFPDDIPIDRCTQQDLSTTGAPVYYNPGSLLLEARYEDEVFQVVRPYACIRVDRHWKVYNAATFNPTKPCIHIPNVPPAFKPTLDPAQYPGMIVSPDTATAPWKASAVVLPGDTLPTRYSIFWSDTANCYIGTQYIYIIDTLAPVIDSSTVLYNMVQDTSFNDPFFWKASYWTDPGNGSHDLEEMELNLHVLAQDNFDCMGLQIGYQLWLDLDANGFQETVVLPDMPNIPRGFVRFGNSQNLYTGGELREFDIRNVPLTQKYYCTTQQFKTDTGYIARVVWATDAAPQTFTRPQLPPGYHKVVWEISDGCGNTQKDTQLIVVQGSTLLGGFAGVAIRFPDDVLTYGCLGQFEIPSPVLLNTFNLPIKITYEDQPIINSNYCQSIDRYWTIYNENTLDLGKPGILVPNPTVSAIAANPANLPGPTIAPKDFPAPWAPSFVKTQPTQTIPTDFSTFWSSLTNYYNFKQTIRLQKNKPPVILSCSDIVPETADTTLNDTLFWNAPYWLDHASGGNDLPESPVALEIAAFDSCLGTSIFPSYQLLLDLDQDGTPETNVTSYGPYTPGTVVYNNLNGLGETRYFDQRNVAANAKYKFGMQSKLVNNFLQYAPAWYASTNSNIFYPIQFPPGAHQILWRIEDLCGNSTSCKTYFTIPFDSLVGTNEAFQDASFQLRSRPNPFREQTQLTFELPEAGPFTVEVYDGQGELVQTQNGFYEAGKHSLRLQMDGPAGFYYAILRGSTGFARCKLLKTP
jgi:hypothetical protein